jgi:glycerol-3-phosphate dehydrogenase (NAD(P)+)
LATIAILGAGDMGTALCTPLAANGHAVRLWGTHLDRDIVAALRAGLPHPRLGVAVPDGVAVLADDRTDDAIRGADVVLFAISSVGIRAIAERFAPWLPAVPCVVTVAKGFDPDPAGGPPLLLTDVIGERTASPIVGVGGPSKANEVARGIPTAVVFAGPEAATADCAALFRNGTYHVETSRDLIGVEIAAAMKNAYAVALAVADGLELATGIPHHNLRAAMFPRADAEMARFAAALGGQPESDAGLAGAGDLQVRISSGRNRLLGERIGAGERGPDAVRALREAGITIEGYDALGYGRARAASLADADGEPLRLPLLDALWRVLHHGDPPLETLWAAI